MSLTIPRELLDRLDLACWTGLSAGERIEIGHRLTALFQADGRRFEQMELNGHGPEKDRFLLEWQDAETGLTFVLIPGGTYAPGYSPERIALYEQHYQAVEGWRDELEEEEDGIEEDSDDPPVEIVPDTPAATCIFASPARCDLRQKPPVTVAPFLMAVHPVLVNTPGLSEVLIMPEWWGKPDSENEEARMRWVMVAPVLERFRWDLPTTTEYEWAARGGEEKLFYWGDDLPSFILEDGDPEEMYEGKPEPNGVAFADIMLWGINPDRPRQWPYANRFGLVGMAAWGTWCEPSTANDDPYPLIVRGGASDCYPWQACGEWKSLLTAAEGRLAHTSDYGDWNALRPVLHLTAE